MAALEALFGPGLIYDDGDAKLQMGFAQSFTTNDSGKTWTMTLRPNLTFSDGTPFDAAAVAFNFARLADKATGSPFQSAAAQLSTTVVNATTLQITSNPGNSQLPDIVAQEFAFVPSPTAVKAEGSTFGSKPVGAGPFKVDQYEPGIAWDFVRNDNYSTFAPGQPYADKYRLLSIAAPENAVAAIQTGQAQLWRATSLSDVALGTKAGLKAIVKPQPAIGTLSFNVSKPPFNNIVAREAVYLALDPKAIANVWLPGNDVATNLFASSSPFYNAKYDYPKQDKAKAQQLFDQLAAAGTPLKFSITWPSVGATVGNVGAYVLGALASFKNVTVTENAVTNAVYTQQKNAGDFQLTSGGLPSTIPGVFQALQTGGSSNYGKFSDSKLDAALTQLQSTTDQAQQKTAWTTIEQEINTQYPYLPTWQGGFGFVYPDNKVGGISPVQFGQSALLGAIYLK